jgi:hypothetical protein
MPGALARMSSTESAAITFSRSSRWPTSTGARVIESQVRATRAHCRAIGPARQVSNAGVGSQTSAAP